jgi:hypothetical protein
MSDIIAKNSIKVEVTQLPIIKSDLSVLKDNIESLLKKYDFIVSEDDIKAVRVKTTELNKLATTLDTLRKEKVKEVSEPIKIFEKEVKEIYSMIKETRQTLLNQMVKFENETKQKLEKLLKEELKALNEIHDIKPEFQKTICADLVKLTNLTKGGKLTKKTSDELQNRVLKDKQLQDIIQSRLIALDGICLKAGLETPLQKHNVQHFLFSENYEEQLQQLIEVELKRQDETKRRVIQQMEDKRIRDEEALKKQESVKKAEEVQKTEEIVKQTISTIQEPSPKNLTPVNNTAKYQITVAMEFETKDMSIEMLKKATQDRFIKCGFKSIKDIKVVKSEMLYKGDNTLLKAGSLF